MEENKKLYSQKAITVATFFGGPLAAGILVRKNCIVLEREQQGLYALIIGILSTILIFSSVFLIPESVLDKIPNIVVPTIYTAIIYLIVEKIQGKDLAAHQAAGDLFYSNWRAAGVGTVCCAIIFAVLLGGAYWEEKRLNNWDIEQYNTQIDRFDQNDALSLEFYDMMDNKPAKQVLEHIETVSIPKLQENMDLLKELDRIENIPSEFQGYNSLLREYCQIRVEICKLITKAVEEDTDAYDKQMEELNLKLGDVISRINE